MYNFNSPITPNNMMYGGQFSPPTSYLQGNGNMIGISNQGYNNPMMNSGGYYNNNYTIFNPYLAEQQRKAEEARRMESLRQRSDMMKVLSRKVNKSLGNEISEKRLKDLYDPPEFRTSENDLFIQSTMRLVSINEYNTQNPFVYQNPLYIAMGIQQEQNQKKLDPNITLHEFLETGGQIISDSIKDEVKRNSKQVDQIYNRADYQKLIDMRAGNSTFGKTFSPNANIDDISIELPIHLKNNYQLKKEKFLEAIINGGRYNG